MENKPFTKDDGSLLFRPGGHGALLANLNDIDADVLVIKNIDNVVKESLLDETIRWKKILVGMATELQAKVFGYLKQLDEQGDAVSAELVAEIKEFMEILADKNNYPIYYHCNIGTDRTGMLSYLIGGLCGMSEEDLMKDYLFSNFGNIGEAKTPHNSKNTYVELLSSDGPYEGDTLVERIESYFISIGVSEETYTAVRDILLGN